MDASMLGGTPLPCIPTLCILIIIIITRVYCEIQNLSARHITLRIYTLKFRSHTKHNTNNL